MEQKEVEDCEFCNGTGFVDDIEFDTSIHQYVKVGLIECKHPTLNYEDYSESL